MLSRVLGTIAAHGLCAAGDRLLAAVSGGPDSTALLHALLTLAPRLGVTVRAAVVDHGLRPESAAEARLVARRCRELGVACEVLTVEVARHRRRHGSVQEAARAARLDGLEALAERRDCTAIALGHTADDQAETVLFRVLRGTGLAGLAGIPYRRGTLVRPLLDVRRSEILAYLGRRKLPFVADPSNADRRYARARIRHDVLPLLARENPRVAEALIDLARQARATPARPWLATLPADLYLPERTRKVVDRLVARAEGTRRVAAAGGAIVVRYGVVDWEAGVGNPRPLGAGRSSARIARPGVYRVAPPPALAVEVTHPQASPPPLGNAAAFDPAKVGWPLWVRAPRSGDRMHPRGGLGSRKLADLLIDAKVPREQRAFLPVVGEAGGALLFVPGLRPSEVGRPGPDTREWFELRLAR